MLVRAIATGFYGKLREPGTPDGTFEVPEGSKASWYVPAGEGDDGKHAASSRAARSDGQGATKPQSTKPASSSQGSSTGQSQAESVKNDAKP